MAWVFTENRLGQSRVGDIDDEQKVPLGTILRAYDPTYGEGEFIYLTGLTGTVAGTAVTYSMDDGSTALLTGDAIGPVAFATAATVGSTYGWYQIGGNAVAQAAASVSDNAVLYIDGTDGLVDDSVVAGDRIKRAKAASASDTVAGAIRVEIERPFTDDIAD